MSKFKEIEDFAFKQGVLKERKRILRIIDNVRIRKTTSYPTMLRHYYISQRDLEELKQRIEEKKE
jgi:hypothetical protein